MVVGEVTAPASWNGCRHGSQAAVSLANCPVGTSSPAWPAGGLHTSVADRRSRGREHFRQFCRWPPSRPRLNMGASAQAARSAPARCTGCAPVSRPASICHYPTTSPVFVASAVAQLFCPSLDAVDELSGENVSPSRVQYSHPAPAAAAARRPPSPCRRRPTGGMGEDLALPLAVATGGRLTNILGGSPIRFDDAHAGGLGIAGGTPLQDAEVAEAALARVGAQAVPGAQ